MPKPEEDDGWIWGSSRGGGGAPLRDPSGKTVANLRAVVRGDVAVDYSPSNSPSRRVNSSAFNDDDDDDAYAHGGGRSILRGSRGVDDYDEYPEPPQMQKRSKGRKSVAYADDYESTKEDDSRRRGHGGDKRAGFDDEPRTLDVRAARGGGGKTTKRDKASYDEDLGGGSGRRRDREREREREPRGHDRAQSPIETGSPKKFMNSLRQMNTSALPEELAAKARKETEYQSQLRAQIEEKKRKKDEEERKAEETKKRELEEYLRVHYKGKIPDYVLQKLPSKSGKSSSFDRTDNGESIYSVGRKAKFPDEDDVDGDGEAYGHGGCGGGPRKSGGRGGRRAQPAADDEALALTFDDDDFDGRASHDNARRSGGGGGGGAGPRRRPGPDRDDKYVSQSEYDELSALCDRLLVQQDTLQTELRNQAKLLKSIQPSAPRGGQRGASPAMRARSVQNGARRPPMPPSGPQSASKASSMGLGMRPNFTARSEAVVPKVAFGRAIDEAKVAKPGGGSGSGSLVDPQKRTIMRAGGAATGKMLMKAESKAAALQQQQQQRGRGISPARQALRDPSPATGGFAKLQHAKVTGPLVVSYDEEGRELRGGRQQGPGRGGGGGGGGGNNNALRSSELAGESEYLRIGGEEVDVISGDQLDRLLAKARRARGGGGRD